VASSTRQSLDSPQFCCCHLRCRVGCVRECHAGSMWRADSRDGGQPGGGRPGAAERADPVTASNRDRITSQIHILRGQPGVPISCCKKVSHWYP